MRLLAVCYQDSMTNATINRLGICKKGQALFGACPLEAIKACSLII
jgi:hypothetical protein